LVSSHDATPSVGGIRRPLARLLVALAVGTAAFVPTAAAPAPIVVEAQVAQVAQVAPVLARVRPSDPEELLRVLINEARAGSAGPLRMYGKLIKIARRHSGRMAASGGIYHNPNLAQNANRIRWSILGENVGVGNSIETLHQAFMNSPPHRENVMRSRFRKVGVGVVERDGRLWVTVVFLG
jgi:uncharacterized protein YkwD